ncbi:hypothetical protein CDIMF43_280170 [Carnobacterium divergens]|nr:hypothetical protein CDIMF43_280170 [Carnobacterium divergens]
MNPNLSSFKNKINEARGYLRERLKNEKIKHFFFDDSNGHSHANSFIKTCRSRNRDANICKCRVTRKSV